MGNSKFKIVGAIEQLLNNQISLEKDLYQLIDQSRDKINH